MPVANGALASRPVYRSTTWPRCGRQPTPDAIALDHHLDGYEGKTAMVRPPATFDLATCDADDGDHYVESWTASDGDRYQQGPGQVDRLWILDVDGQIFIDVTSTPGTERWTRGDDRIVESIDIGPEQPAEAGPRG